MAVIKNVRKYGDNIKLAQGLILSMSKIQRRIGDYGVSTKDFGSFWFKTPKGNVLFKTGNGRVSEINEIACYKLAQKMSISCAKYEPASLAVNKSDGSGAKHYQGVASYNFLKPDDQLVSLYEFLPEMRSRKGFDPSFVSVVNLLQEICTSRKDKIDIEQITRGLFEMTIFDLLTFQSDRHTHNVSFIIDKDKNIKLSPLYDNEFAFFEIRRQFYYDDFDTVEEFLDNYFCHAGFLPPMQTSSSVKNAEVGGLETYRIFAQQVAQLAKSNPKLDEVFKRMIGNFNLDQVFAELEDEGYVLDEDYKTFALELTKFAKREMIKAYNQTSKNYDDQNCR